MKPKLLHPYAKPAKDKEKFRELVRGEGVRVWDTEGNEYIDGMGSLWLCQVGHGRTEIADAVHKQLSTIAYNVFDPWSHAAPEELAERISDLSPLEGSRVFMCCSGSEAVDTAFKLTRQVAQLKGEPDRQIILTRTRGYHGIAGAGTSLQGIAANREGWGDLLPHIIEIDPDDIESAARVFAEHGDRIAGVFSEPVQGAGGVWPPTEEYMRRLRELCDKAGALLVFDEVICGFGRTGEWFAAQTYGVKPDLMTFAKGVTSGYQPLGGVIVSREICDLFESDPDFYFRHGFTYSGHPASAVAGLVNLDIIEREGLIQRAKEIDVKFSGGLAAMVSDGTLSGYRGVGALWSAQLPEGTTPEHTIACRDAALDKGVIFRPIGDSLAFCPPLIIDDADLDRCLDVLADVLT
ncbi:MAG: putrescine aminotransferase [Acidimicrobiales bacterium]|jgi:adenosylmethionine-8-amino-7-oxononanoate aminotransferase